MTAARYRCALRIGPSGYITNPDWFYDYRSQVHADFKPLNVVRLKDKSFRIIDLDAIVKLGSAAGFKTSTAYCPPQMAYLDDGGLVRFKDPTQSLPTDIAPCLAKPWFDFWSFGCVLYRALARKPLFQADDADNLYSQGEKKRLFHWSASDLDAALRDVSVVLRALEVNPAQILAATDVLAWTLHPDESMRPDSGVELLSHAFFSTQSSEVLPHTFFSASAWLLHPNESDRPNSGPDPNSGPELRHHAFFSAQGATGATELRMSALHRSAALGESESVRRLLETMPANDILSEDHLLKKTPLDLAVIGLHKDTVLTLLRAAENAGDDGTAPILTTAPTQNKDGSAVHTFPQPSLGSVLYKCVNALDSQHDTPLHSLLKLLERLGSDAAIASIDIIEVLYPITDTSIQDSLGRTVLDIGNSSPVPRVRETSQRVFLSQITKTRCELFRESVLSNTGTALEPWGLPKREFQAWLRKQAGSKNKGALKELIDAMTEVDGLAVLSAWVEIGFDGQSANCGKLNLSKIKEHLKIDVKVITIQHLANLLGQLPLGKRAINSVLQPGGLSYHKAVLQSCEKRSLLSDYSWVKTVGEGSFGRAHLCTCVLVSCVDHSD